MTNDLIGKPFRSKGRGLDNYDCWGLAIEVLRREGINIPEFDIDAYAYSVVSAKMQEQILDPRWKKLKNPEKNCIIAIKEHPKFVQHVGVYLGYGKFIHAGANGVEVRRLNDFKKQIRGFYKYVE